MRASDGDMSAGLDVPALPPSKAWRRLGVIAAVVVFLAAWESTSGLLVASYFISRPSAVGHKLLEWAASGYLWPHLVFTLVTTVLGFAIAAISGTALGLILGSNDRLGQIFKPFIYAGFTLPKVVLAPLIIFWFGIGFQPSLIMSAITGFFFVFFNVYSGIIKTNQNLLNMVKILGASGAVTTLKVRLPSAMPEVFHGLHQGLIYAFHGAVVGEMTASNRGMGYVIVYASTEMDSSAVIAGLVVLGIASYALVYGLQKIERRVALRQGREEL